MTNGESVAILAPVPLEHLESGVAIANREGFVAFGSKKWEFFRKLDQVRGGRAIPVLIYPSHENAPAEMSLRVTWFGWYFERVESPRGRHPAGMQYRPETTAQNATDNQGHWAVFWHVRGLRALNRRHWLRISQLQTVKGGWRKDAPPRGPELVAMPPELADEE